MDEGRKRQECVEEEEGFISWQEMESAARPNFSSNVSNLSDVSAANKTPHLPWNVLLLLKRVWKLKAHVSHQITGYSRCLLHTTNHNETLGETQSAICLEYHIKMPRNEYLEVDVMPYQWSLETVAAFVLFPFKSGCWSFLSEVIILHFTSSHLISILSVLLPQ